MDAKGKKCNFCDEMCVCVCVCVCVVRISKSKKPWESVLRMSCKMRGVERVGTTVTETDVCFKVTQTRTA